MMTPKYFLLFILFFATGMTGCATTTIIPNMTPTMSVTPDLRKMEKVVWASVDEIPAALIHTVTTMTVIFRPRLRFNRSASQEWIDHNIVEMDVCQQPCILSEQWKPFAPSYKCSVEIKNIGFQGLECHLRARFRTADGTILYPVEYWSYRDNLDENLSILTGGYGVFNAMTPVTAYPTEEQFYAAATATQMTFAQNHVAGSFQLNNQNAGKTSATEGTTFTLVLGFQATSPFANITEMRMLREGAWRIKGTTNVNAFGITCAGDYRMVESPWEPFVPKKEYPMPVNFVNQWVTFSYAVQYRDKLGNVSPVYCDVLEVEGMYAP